jgi:hypothetical protein
MQDDAETEFALLVNRYEGLWGALRAEVARANSGLSEQHIPARERELDYAWEAVVSFTPRKRSEWVAKLEFLRANLKINNEMPQEIDRCFDVIVRDIQSISSSFS